ncbi:MAG: hypothetical protein EBS28_03195, partial [Chlamydiae bacterium]|nr:hypothetical protein [Chlamydiota bacterium]
MSFKWKTIPRPILESLIRKTSSGAYGLECSQTDCASLIEAGCVYENGTLYFERFYKQKKELEILAQKRSSYRAIEIPRSEEADPRLNQEQKKALEAVFQTSTLLLQGGPGSGKTFTISCLIPLFITSFETFFDRKPRILLAAQTAKAVHHLAKQIPKGAMDQIDVETLHRVLRISKGLKAPLKTVVDHDLIIVDESSMIDGDMMNLFLNSLKPTSRVIFLGDPRQLPPIEGGAPFKWLLQSRLFETHFLPGSMRAENKELIDQANRLFDGVMPPTRPLDSFQLEQILSRFDQPVDLRPTPNFSSRYKILSSMRVGPYGSIELSNRIFNLLKEQKGRYLLVPIMITQNSDPMQLYNGQEGVHLFDKKGAEQLAYFPHLENPIALMLL